MNKWISIAERLPDLHEKVWVATLERGELVVTTDHLVHDNYYGTLRPPKWRFYGFMDVPGCAVTHWMPYVVPDPPVIA